MRLSLKDTVYTEIYSKINYVGNIATTLTAAHRRGRNRTSNCRDSKHRNLTVVQFYKAWGSVVVKALLY